MNQSQHAGQHPMQRGSDQFQMFETRTYLTEDIRRTIINQLNQTLADTTVLMTHAKFAHWNVKGMEFYGLHQLFDEIAGIFQGHIDDLAERITALGGQAMGTAGMAVAGCRLPAMPTEIVVGREFVEVLADRIAIHDANLYEDIESVNEYGDPDTADLLNEISRQVSQYLWFLEAHLQAQPPSSGHQANAQYSDNQPSFDQRGQHHQSMTTAPSIPPSQQPF